MKRLDDCFKESLLRALDEDRHDDLALLLANRLCPRQNVISLHARAALPVDKDLCQALITNYLRKSELGAFNIHETGWYIIAVQDCRVVRAEPFPYTFDDPQYRARITDYVNALSDDDGILDVYGAYHQNGKFTHFQHLYGFRPESRRA